jgi:hypothetical protein
VRLGLNVQGSSALPYNITTGLDTNGDTVFNDRAAGVERNSARGATQWTTNIRINKSIGLGGVRSGPPNMPMPPPPPSGGGAMNQRVGGGGPGGGDGPQMVVMEVRTRSIASTCSRTSRTRSTTSTTTPSSATSSRRSSVRRRPPVRRGASSWASQLGSDDGRSPEGWSIPGAN